MTAQAELPLAPLPAAARYVVAFSGGRDSTVLLHVLWQRKVPLRAVHVDHGLQPASAAWAAHCQTIAARWSVPLTNLSVRERPPQAGIEAWARARRYALLGEDLAPGECLLTAHHAGDQAETVLLHLLRGSGLDGLAGIPQQRSLGEGLLFRPLLAVTPAQLAGYAQAQDLAWIEDPSNADLTVDRNALRHTVIAPLCARFPHALGGIAHSSELLRDAADWQARTLDEELAALRADDGGLLLSALMTRNEAQRNRLLRRHLQALGLPPPRRRMLADIWRQMAAAHPDARPCLRWPGVELRRERGRLYVIPSLPIWQPITFAIAGQGQRDWPGGGRVVWQLPETPGWRVASPRGGERVSLAGGGHQSLNKHLAGKGVLSWQRQRVPLLWRGETLMAVGRSWRSPELPSGAWFWQV